MASPTFEYDNGPITIGDEAWLGAQALILRGVTIGKGSVIAARARVSSDVLAGSLFQPYPIAGAHRDLKGYP
jgi:putative colanic acid biosynthesis acetyltransferase WcaF